MTSRTATQAACLESVLDETHRAHERQSAREHLAAMSPERRAELEREWNAPC